MAPEVLEGHFNEKCDIWSIGVLLYVFMSGYLPFQG
jgi:calcium-dependent protein kinase